MRYLARLARETTATVKPRSTPSWLDSAVPFTVYSAHEAVTEARVGSAGTEFRAARDSGFAPESTDVASGGWNAAGIESPTGKTVRQADSRRTQSNEAAAPRQDSELPAEPTVAAAAAKSPRKTATKEVLVDRAIRDAHTSEGRVSNAAAAHNADSVRGASSGETGVAGINPGTTLQSVLSELARRQKLLDERQDPSAADARPPARESSTPPSVAHVDEPRLEIGSIVVQVMPEPPPNPGPRAAKPRPTSAPDRRWARSFLDRST